MKTIVQHFLNANIRRHLPVAAVFICLAIVIHLMIDMTRANKVKDARANIARQTNSLVARLESDINANIYLANGLLALVGENADPSRWNNALKTMYEKGKYLRLLSIAPNNRISHIYPLEPYRDLIGKTFVDISPDRMPGIQVAMEKKQTVVTGPMPLVHGGTGLVSRTPVVLSDGSYWGMITLSMELDTVFESIGLRPEVNGVKYAFRGRDAKGTSGEVFFGDPALFETDAIFITISIPGGSWVLATKPTEGWVDGLSYLNAAEYVALLFNLLFCSFLISYRNNRMRIEANEQRMRTFLETSQDGVIVIDGEGNIHEFNPASEALFGYRAQEMIGTPISRLMPPEIGESYREFICDNPQRKLATSYQFNAICRDGSVVPVEVSIGSVSAKEQRMHVAIVRDVSERRAYEQQLLALATTDGLTGLLNRRTFQERASNALRLAHRGSRQLSVLLIDADHFKKINDTYGHAAGDKVLQSLAANLKLAYRSTDEIARYGGEEFIALLPDTDFPHAVEAAERLLHAIRASAVAIKDEAPIHYTVSIGIATSAENDTEILELIRRADEALYVAKAAGRNRWASSKLS